MSGLNTLGVTVRVVSVSRLCLSGLCYCPGYVSVRVVSVRVMSCPGCVTVRVLLCPVCVMSGLRYCPGYVTVRVVSVSGLCRVRVKSVRVVSVRVVCCPGCVCPGYVVAPKDDLKKLRQTQKLKHT